MNCEHPEPTPAPPDLAAFPAVSLDDWRAKVGDRAVDGVPVTALEDGIEVPWLFTGADLPTPDPAGSPGRAPFIRGVAPGTPWDVRQEQALPTRAAARRATLADLEGGATSVLLRLDEAASDALDPGDPEFADACGRDGIALYDLDDLDDVLDGVYTDFAPIALDAGAAGRAAAALLVALWQRRGHDLQEVAGALRIDPIGALAATGTALASPPDAVAEALQTVAELDGVLGPRVTVLAVDTAPYAGAGASAAQELGVALATAAAYLRAGEEAGVDPARVAARLELTFQGDADQFLGIAKIRAARRTWARILEACGVDPDGRRSPIVSRTSQRMLAAVDPWVNMLRATTAAFAAAVGGADGVSVTAFDAPRGIGSELGRRIARNTQHVLMDEAHIARVGDPGGGAWYVEWLTDRLAHAAWDELQRIEAGGGVLAELANGRIAARIADGAARRAHEVADRERVLTGVNSFPLLGPDGVPQPEVADAATPQAPSPRPAAPRARLGARFAELVELATAGARIDELCAAGRYRSLPFAAVREARAFESLRERAAAIDPAPTVQLACVGPIARHNAVATWMRSFFEAGGIAAAQSDPIADPSAVAATGPLAAVCADPEEDPALVAAVVAALRDAGAHVYLAQATPERATAAGADEAIADGDDLVAVLTAALDRCEQEPAR